VTKPKVAFRRFEKEPKKPTQNQTHLHNIIIPNILCIQQDLLFDVFFSFCVLLILQKILLQNWGDYADMSQALIVYVSYTSDVLLICWFGTQLTQHVRQNVFFLFFLFLVLTLKHYVHNVYGASNQLSNYISILVFRIFPT
jgi:hypothetical protein